jgi:hypothetical protein
MPNPFTQPGSFLRGNLHSHTTASDGCFSPQQTVDTYAQAGFDFLALTDHNQVTPVGALDARGMVLLTGAEVTLPGGPFGGTIHVVALGGEQSPTVPPSASPAQAMAAVARQASLCFVAHPHWCLVDCAQLLPLSAFIGLEVFNTGCLMDHNRGNSEAAWDALLAHGRPLWGLATDDGHHPPALGYAWTAIKTPDRTPAGLLAALRRGDLYASTGPELRGLTASGSHLLVDCSPCVQAALLGARPGCGSSTWYDLDLARPFEQARLPLPTTEGWLRVEIIDAQGNKAWSNAFQWEEI